MTKLQLLSSQQERKKKNFFEKEILYNLVLKNQPKYTSGFPTTCLKRL